jgi:hypothetical protein
VHVLRVAIEGILNRLLNIKSLNLVFLHLLDNLDDVFNARIRYCVSSHYMVTLFEGDASFAHLDSMHGISDPFAIGQFGPRRAAKSVISPD